MWKNGHDVKECPGGAPKKCFKGVENFLRRVSFNLGNSPSQTEVKIISCIPIDVTDLQQKINYLERQLEDATRPVTSCCRMLGTPRPIAVHTAATAPACGGGACPPPPRTPAAPADTSPQLTSPENCSRRKSVVSLTIPIQKCKPQSQTEPRSSCTSYDTEPRKKNLFKRYKKSRNDSPLVYYAQTTSSPFTSYRKEIAARRELKRMDAKVDEPYVGNLLRKQYGPEMHLELEQWAGASSQSSAPVCRDQRAPQDVAPPACARDADACSCCRGRFYDIDQDCRPFLDNSLSTNMHRNVDSGNIFYNSVYYDIFPVKEKEKRETDKYKTWEQTFQFDDNCFRQNYITNIESRPVLNTKLTSALRFANKKSRKLRKWRDSAPKRPSTKESSGNIIVECSDIYLKDSFSKKRKEKLNNKTVLLKDVECLTHNVNDTECQTESSKNMRPEEAETLEENQTETTLNQIKTILQSVLSHVKTNNLIKQTDSKEKKDAIVQKELQPNILPVCSRLANMYTYSPFSMDPYAPAACSTVMPLHPAPPTTHFKCMNSFPVFTQHSTPPRQYIGCCNPRPRVNSQLIQTSANTLFPAEAKCSKQTENLIKEIYGTLERNILESQTPNNDSNDTGPRNVSTNEPGDQGDPVISNVMTMSRQVGPRTPSDRVQSRAVSAATSPATSSTTSKSSSEQRSARGSGDQRSVRSAPRRAPPPARFARRDSAATSASERRPRQRPDAIADSESSSEDTESASDHTVVPTKPSEKNTKNPSIFKKLFGSVFSRGKRVIFRKAPSSIASTSSDSDDCQTDYSATAERPKRLTCAPTPRAERRMPYMEQEYRRYWDEQLMFQRPQTKYSSEQAPPRPRSIRLRPPGIYFHKCEARPTLIDRTSSDPEQAAPPSRTRKNVIVKVPNRKMSWPKKHSPKIKCAEQWTRVMLDN